MGGRTGGGWEWGQGDSICLRLLESGGERNGLLQTRGGNKLQDRASAISMMRHIKWCHPFFLFFFLACMLNDQDKSRTSQNKKCHLCGLCYPERTHIKDELGLWSSREVRKVKGTTIN